MISSRVTGRQAFGKVVQIEEAKARRALNVAAEEAAAEASRVAGRRRRTGKMSAFDALAARGDVSGYSSGIRNDKAAWYERYQNDGTLSHRTAEKGVKGKKRLKAQTLRRRSTPSGQERFAKVSGRKGIEGLHFFEAGRTAGRRALLRELRIR